MVDKKTLGRRLPHTKSVQMTAARVHQVAVVDLNGATFSDTQLLVRTRVQTTQVANLVRFAGRPGRERYWTSCRHGAGVHDGLVVGGSACRATWCVEPWTAPLCGTGSQP